MYFLWLFDICTAQISSYVHVFISMLFTTNIH